MVLTPSGTEPKSQSHWGRRAGHLSNVQRVVLALGALATALIAIYAVGSGLLGFVDRDDDRLSAEAPPGVVRVQSQTADADRLIRDLIDHDGTVVELNHQILGTPGPAHVSVEYACDPTSGCSVVRLQDGRVTYDVIDGGLWFQGCYQVVVDGNGYGAQGLDIELAFRGSTCPN